MDVFYSCEKLEVITIPSSVTSLESSLFEKCTNLKQINATEELYANFPYVFNDVSDKVIKYRLLENNATVKGKTAKVKYKKLRKKNQKIAASKLFTISPKQGAWYVKVSGKKKIVINKYNGVVTVKKKLKKGTYKVKVKVLATGDSTYKAASTWKVVTIKIKVK